jgi:hypothetical protein
MSTDSSNDQQNSNRESTEARTGYDDFISIVKKFNALSGLIVAAGASVPFLASLVDVVPPYPGAAMITALVELVALVLAFQFYRTSPRRKINRVMAIAAVLLFAVGAVYLLAFTVMTEPHPDGKSRIVRGFICRADIPQVTAAECPMVSRQRIANAKFVADNIWQPWTVQLTSWALVIMWLSLFLLLSTLLGVFLVFQTRQPNKGPPVPAGLY